MFADWLHHQSGLVGNSVLPVQLDRDYTVTEVTAFLNVDRYTVTAMCAEGYFPNLYRQGGPNRAPTKRIPGGDVVAYRERAIAQIEKWVRSAAEAFESGEMRKDYTAREAASIMQLPLVTVLGLARSGFLPGAYRSGRADAGAIRLPEVSVFRYLASWLSWSCQPLLRAPDPDFHLMAITPARSTSDAAQPDLTVREAAFLLNLSTKAVTTLIYRDKLPGSYRTGAGGPRSPFRVPRAAIEHFRLMQPHADGRRQRAMGSSTRRP